MGSSGPLRLGFRLGGRRGEELEMINVGREKVYSGPVSEVPTYDGLVLLFWACGEEVCHRGRAWWRTKLTSCPRNKESEEGAGVPLSPQGHTSSDLKICPRPHLLEGSAIS